MGLGKILQLRGQTPFKIIVYFQLVQNTSSYQAHCEHNALRCVYSYKVTVNTFYGQLPQSVTSSLLVAIYHTLMPSPIFRRVSHGCRSTLALVSISHFMSGSLGSAHCSYLKDCKENLHMNKHSTPNNEDFHEWGTVLRLTGFTGLSMDDLLWRGAEI